MKGFNSLVQNTSNKLVHIICSAFFDDLNDPTNADGGYDGGNGGRWDK